MWRLYRYRAGTRDSFPIHYDNSTAKAPGCKSFLSVLVYLTGGFQGSGGGTAFYDTEKYRAHLVPFQRRVKRLREAPDANNEDLEEAQKRLLHEVMNPPKYCKV